MSAAATSAASCSCLCHAIAASACFRLSAAVDPSQQGSQFTPSDSSTQLIIGLCAGIASVVGLVMVVESRPLGTLGTLGTTSLVLKPAPSYRTALLVIPLR